MKSKIFTVTIGIPAHNEENNIKNLLENIIMQNQKKYLIEKIIIALDGCTDATRNISESVKDKRIEFIEDGKRIGQSARLNQFFKISKSNYLVLLDADIILVDNNFIEKLIEPLSDSNVALTSGLAYPKKAETFIEQGVNSTVDAYIKIRNEIHQGNNIYSCIGRSLALSKSFYASIVIPQSIYASDAYLYLLCVSKNLKFRYIPSAKSEYRSPATLADQISQNSRFTGSGNNLIPIFGNLVKQEYFIPKKLLTEYYLFQFLKDPIHSIAIFIVNIFSKITNKCKYDTIWDIRTSKKGIKNAQD